MLPVTGFWMRNNSEGYIEILAETNGQWVTVFGPRGPGPAARDADQMIDHCIHSGGIQNLIDFGTVHAPQLRICASCGNLEKPHRYRHQFVAWEPGMPTPPGHSQKARKR